MFDRKRRAVLAILAVLLPCPASGQAIAIARRVDARQVAIFGGDGRAPQGAYRSGAVQVLEMQIAPAGDLIAIVELKEGADRQNQLAIVGPDGHLLRTIGKNVRAMTWCCGAGQLAVITGSWSEGTDWGFDPGEAYLIDGRTGTATLLAVPTSYEVAWGDFDQALYFRTTGDRATASNVVLRYDLRSHTWHNTQYSDLRFSPTGDHYLHFGVGPSERAARWHVIERRTGREVPLPTGFKGGIDGWAFGDGDYLRLVPAGPPSSSMIASAASRTGAIDYAIYDVPKAAMLGILRGRAIREAVSPQGTQVILVDSTLRVLRHFDQAKALIRPAR